MSMFSSFGRIIYIWRVKYSRTKPGGASFLRNTLDLVQWGGGEGKGAQHSLWKNDIAQEHNINWLESNGSKMASKWTSTRPWSSGLQYTSIVTHQQAKWHAQRCPDSSKTNPQRPKSRWWPNSWKSLPLPQHSWNNPPTHEPVRLASP